MAVAARRSTIFLFFVLDLWGVAGVIFEENKKNHEKSSKTIVFITYYWFLMIFDEKEWKKHWFYKQRSKCSENWRPLSITFKGDQDLATIGIPAKRTFCRFLESPSKESIFFRVMLRGTPPCDVMGSSKEEPPETLQAEALFG